MVKNLIVIEGVANNWKEAIREASEALLIKGYVKDSFYQACIEREVIFPTGLPTEIPVAIPHTDPDHVIHPSVCLLRLKNPVKFASMEDNEQYLEIEFVFNMALLAGEDQVPMIKAIIDTAQDTKFLRAAKLMSLEEIKKTLYKKWVMMSIIH